MGDMRGTLGGRVGIAALLLVLALHLALCAWGRPGLMASDDYWYAKYAFDLARGEFELAPDSFANRPGLIAPVALSYSLLGVTEVSSVLWNALCSLVAIGLVFLLARSIAGGTAGVVAAAIVGVNSAQLSSSLLLLPDGPTATLLLAAILALRAGRDSTSRAGRLGAAALTAGLVTAAFLTKVSAVWIVPALVVFGAADLLRRRNFDYWGATFSILAVTGTAYLLAYHALTGDALYRLHAIEGGHNLSQFAYTTRTADDLLARLTWEPVALFLRHPELGVPVLLALPAAAAGLIGGGRSRRLVAVCFVTFLAAWWWLTTSLTTWTPLPLNPRMFHPVLPFAVVLAAATLTMRWAGTVAVVVLLAASIAAWPLAGVARAALFAATAVAVAAADPLLRRGFRFAPLLPVVPVALLAVYGVARGGVGETRAQAAERRIVAEHLSAPTEDTAVLTIYRSELALRFRLGFQPSPRLTFVTDEEARRVLAGEDAAPDGARVVFENQARLSFLESRRRTQVDLGTLARERGLLSVDSEAGVTLFR